MLVLLVSLKRKVFRRSSILVGSARNYTILCDFIHQSNTARIFMNLEKCKIFLHHDRWPGALR